MFALSFSPDEDGGAGFDKMLARGRDGDRVGDGGAMDDGVASADEDDKKEQVF